MNIVKNLGAFIFKGLYPKVYVVLEHHHKTGGGFADDVGIGGWAPLEREKVVDARVHGVYFHKTNAEKRADRIAAKKKKCGYLSVLEMKIKDFQSLEEVIL